MSIEVNINLKTLNGESLIGTTDIVIGSSITVGTTPISSGVDNRILFQSAGVTSQDSNFTYDPTLKRLVLKAIGAGAVNVPFSIRNSVDTDNLAYIAGNGLAVIGINSSSSPTLIIDPAGSARATLRGGTNQSILLNSSGWNNLNGGSGGWDIEATGGEIRQRNGSNYTLLSGNYFGIGCTPSARLDVQSHGALSTDLAFRVRNSVNTANLLNVRGDGPVLGVGTNSGNSFAIGGSQGYIGSDTNFTIGALTYASNFKLNIKGNSDIRYQWTHSNGHNASIGYFGGSDLYVFNDSTTNTAVLNTDALRLGINSSLTNIQSSAALQVESTSKGFLPPRMTTTQKNAISSPAAGLVVYDTTLKKLCVFTTAWETITSI